MSIEMLTEKGTAKIAVPDMTQGFGANPSVSHYLVREVDFEGRDMSKICPEGQETAQALFFNGGRVPDSGPWSHLKDGTNKTDFHAWLQKILEFRGVDHHTKIVTAGAYIEKFWERKEK